jgi:hypothetical protein
MVLLSGFVRGPPSWQKVTSFSASSRHFMKFSCVMRFE